MHAWPVLAVAVISELTILWCVRDVEAPGFWPRLQRLTDLLGEHGQASLLLVLHGRPEQASELDLRRRLQAFPRCRLQRHARACSRSQAIRSSVAGVGSTSVILLPDRETACELAALQRLLCWRQEDRGGHCLLGDGRLLRFQASEFAQLPDIPCKSAWLPELFARHGHACRSIHGPEAPGQSLSVWLRQRCAGLLCWWSALGRRRSLGPLA